MNIEYREYCENDYSQCEELVNQAWGFDETFKPARLSGLAKQIYTQASVLESTYMTVAVYNDKVVGFIFGLNELEKQRKLNIGFRLQVLWDFICIKSTSKPNKKDLLKAAANHEKNRSKYVDQKRSELVLFVIDESFQKQKIGTQLWAGFLENCQHSDVKNIVVETNKSGASGFYEKLGFEHRADFYSPLHEFTTPEGQACIYEYKLKND